MKSASLPSGARFKCVGKRIPVGSGCCNIAPLIAFCKMPLPTAMVPPTPAVNKNSPLEIRVCWCLCSAVSHLQHRSKARHAGKGRPIGLFEGCPKISRDACPFVPPGVWLLSELFVLDPVPSPCLVGDVVHELLLVTLVPFLDGFTQFSHKTLALCR